MSNDILCERDGPALRVTFNRPEAGNAATDEMAVELTRILEGAAETSQFVVLRGAGADFCIGRASMGKSPGKKPEALELRQRNEVVFNCYGAFRSAAVPVIAVIQGRALGFGCALAAVADITIASDAARFQVPEMQHNIMPTMVMSSFIDRVPSKAMMYLVYSTAEIDAARALEFGIASEVVAAARLEQTVDALCATLAKTPRAAILAVKEYARAAQGMPLKGAVDFARNIHANINSSSDMRRWDT